MWNAGREEVYDRSTAITCRQRFAMDPLEVPIDDASIVVQYSKPGERPWEIHERMREGRLAGFQDARTAMVVEPDLMLAPRSSASIAMQGRDFCAEALSGVRGQLKSALWWAHQWGFYAGWAVIELGWEPIPAGPLAGFLRPTIREAKPWRIAWKYPNLDAVTPQLYARRKSWAEDVLIPWDRGIWFAPRSSEPYGWTAAATNQNCHPYWDLGRLATVDGAGVVAMVAQILLMGKLAPGMNQNAERADGLRGEMYNLRTLGEALLLNGETIESLGIDSTSGGNTAMPFIDEMNRTMANIVGAQTDSQGMSQGPGAGLAGRKVGGNINAKLVWTDADLLAAGLAEPLCYRILAKNFGTAVAEQATPRATLDCWDAESWELYQAGVLGLLANGAPVDERDAYKLMIRGAPPAPDANVIRKAVEQNNPAVDPSADPAQQVDRAMALARSRDRLEWRTV